MNKVLLSGHTGKMGKEIISLLKKDKELNFEFGVAQEEDFSKIPKEIGIVIDFSSAPFFSDVLEQAVEMKTPFISGTTGLNKSDFDKMDLAAKKIPILWAANMSVGIHLMSEMFKVFKNNSNFDFQIEETHHKQKKDAPSGTALFLQREIEELGVKTVESPLSIRGGGVFGIHNLFAFSQEEIITIKHEALNRRVFARGAIRAAKWLLQKEPGLYEFKNVLGF